MHREMIRERIVCYVAGPLGAREHWEHNTASAIAHANQLQRAGIVPFVPHLFSHWAIAQGDASAPYHVWMGMDEVLVERSDCLLRIPGHSPGADREVAWAKEFQVPVYDTAAAVIRDWEDGSLRPQQPTACWLNWDLGGESNRWPRRR